MGKKRNVYLHLAFIFLSVIFSKTISVAQEIPSGMPPSSVLQKLDSIKTIQGEPNQIPLRPQQQIQSQPEQISPKEETIMEDQKKEVKETKTEIVEQKGEISEIENNFNRTYKDLLKNKSLSQFGYNFFRSVEGERIVPVGDDYIIGPDDRLKVYLWGDPVDVFAVSREFDLTVTKDGNVYIPTIGIVNVSGFRIGDLKNVLRQKFNSKFRNLNIEIILTNPRKLNVYVTGFVNKPGMVTVTSFDTIVTAIVKAGGVSKAGTLRKIELKRKEGGKLNTIEIDFYDLFIKGFPVDINLRDGDIIHVPPIGKIVAIFGDIKRPGIYELKNESSVEDVLSFAGGFNPSVSEMMVRISRYSKDGVNLFEGNLEDKNFLKTKLQNGDFVYFGPKPEVFENSVTIQGEVYYPGIYSINDTKTLKELLLKAKPLVNADYGKIVREDKKVISFNVSDVLEGISDFDLKKKDKVEIYNKFFKEEPIYVIGSIESRTIPFYINMKLRDALINYKLNDEVNYLKALILRKSDKTQEKLKQDKQSIQKETENIKIKNEETQEKTLFRVVYLKDLLLKYDEESNIELQPGDVIIIKKVEDIEKAPSVTVLGEVKYPGKYMINGEEKLSDIIKKAGGYTDKAYPQALIFIRESAKKLQKEQLETTFLVLQEQFLKKSQELSAATQEEREAYSSAIEKSKAELDILKRKAELGLGRIALEIPKTLEDLERSNQNIPLQDGDTIIVPSKPNYVLVLGDVYNQISLPYIDGYTLKDYLNMVGGYRKDADKKGIYIIKANGRVVSQENFSRRFLIASGIEDYKLSEGDTIVVPSEIKVPILWRPLIKDVVQIIFQSISTAVLAKRL